MPPHLLEEALDRLGASTRDEEAEGIVPSARGVEFEAKMITKLLSLSDHEIDLVADCFRGSNLEAFFVGTRWQQTLATAKLAVNLKVLRNWKLIESLFSAR